VLNSWFHNAVTSSCSSAGSALCVCVCVSSISLSFRCLVLCILNNVNVHQICRTLSLPAWEIQRLGSERFLHIDCIMGIYYNFLLKLLLLLLLLSSSSSPLCRVFILIFLRQTISLGNTVLQLFCCYYSWCLYR
jgi:hypothetical protein